VFISQGRRNHMDKIIWLLLGWKEYGNIYSKP
jgi:hypothetical protein